MPEPKELIEKVFQPGNLVHGGDQEKVVSFFNEGIQPACVSRGGGLSDICFAMLSSDPLPKRYDIARHYGNYEKGSPFSVGIVVSNIGIVVSREELLKKFPDNVSAIGNYFWDPSEADNRSRYQYDPRKNTVFDILIRQPKQSLYYPDEVRVYPEDVYRDSVTPETWLGLVIDSFHLRMLLHYLRHCKTIPAIPIFSRSLQLLVENTQQAVLNQKPLTEEELRLFYGPRTIF